MNPVKTPNKPSGCGPERHDARYSVGIEDGKLVIRMKLVAGRCSIGEINWETMWGDLVSGKLQNICLCQAAVDQLGLKW
jgi:hypothetical protein